MLFEKKRETVERREFRFSNKNLLSRREKEKWYKMEM